MSREGGTSQPPSAKRRRTHPAPPAARPPPARAPSTAAATAPSAASPARNGAKWFRNPSVVWFRGHDLRVEDHPALLAAAQRGGPVAPLFIWDECDNFGRDLGTMKRWWLRLSLQALAKDLRKLGVPLFLRVGRSPVELRKFLAASGADAVFWNRCYEPELLERDEEMRQELGAEGMTAESFKAELLVEPWELTNSGARPDFETFHSYMRSWMAFPPPPPPFPCPSRLPVVEAHVPVGHIDDLKLSIPKDLEETLSELWIPGSAQAKVQLEKFLQEIFPVFGEGRCRRHFKGTSRLSPHVRFGELSPRRMYHATRVCVSRWDPNSDVSPAMVALGLPADGKPKATKAVDAVERQESNEDIGPNDANNGADSSSTGNLSGNTASQQKGQPKKASRKPRADEDTKAAKGDGEMNSLCNAMRLPHISRSAKAFLKNLCLRDFSYHVLFHHPDFDSKPLVPEFAQFPWAPDEGSFDAWRMGRTGYPLVDAAMRELRSTGWVHNSMRFLLACFLTKYLLLPWQRGLKEFYDLLLDGDHSSNALGWQWTSGSNTDAFPFSCLVNPVKFGALLDPSGDYVRRWIPELAKLSNKFIHEPWNAPGATQTAAGLTLGGSYPVRIVIVRNARRRAKDAMLHMRKIFAEVCPTRRLSSLPVDDLLKDWPERSCENNCCATEDDIGLLPSLWSLVHTGDISSPIRNSFPGFEDDVGRKGSVELDSSNQDSIERALLSANSSPDPESLLDGDILLSGNVTSATLANDATAIEVPERKNLPSKAGGQDSVYPHPGEHAPERQDGPAKNTTADVPNGHHNAVSSAAGVAAYNGMQQFPGGAVHPSYAAHPPLVMHAQMNQVHQQNAQHQMGVYDALYGGAIGGANHAGVPISNFPVLMPGQELGVPNGMNPHDFHQAMYAHQMNLTQMYGLPSVVPVIPPQRAEQRAAEAQGVPAAVGNGRPMAVSMGMYAGSPGLDPNGFANVLGMADASRYAAVHAGGPHQNHAAAHSQIPPHHSVYMAPGNVENMHPANGLYPRPPDQASNLIPAAATGNAVVKSRNIAPGGTLQNGFPGAPHDGKVPQKNSVRKQQVVSPPTPGQQSGDSGTPNRRDGANVTSQRGRAGSKSSRGRSRNTGNAAPRGAAGRRDSSKGSIAKGTRGKKTGGRGGKKRADARGAGSSSGTAGASSSGGGDAESIANALKSRQQVLKSVGEKEDHEYYHFARFLIGTYELTGNTDRHLSKDYIRLCTLKDNYHKQCQTDTEKLKIYRIKAFFSQILELEVTGEWDRHNHGGVRGPYVYGIRLKSEVDDADGRSSAAPK